MSDRTAQIGVAADLIAETTMLLLLKAMPGLLKAGHLTAQDLIDSTRFIDKALDVPGAFDPQIADNLTAIRNRLMDAAARAPRQEEDGGTPRRIL